MKFGASPHFQMLQSMYDPGVCDSYHVCVPASWEATVWMWWLAAYLVWIWISSTNPRVPSSHMLQRCSKYLCHFSCFKVHPPLTLTYIILPHFRKIIHAFWMNWETLTTFNFSGCFPFFLPLLELMGVTIFSNTSISFFKKFVEKIRADRNMSSQKVRKIPESKGNHGMILILLSKYCYIISCGDFNQIMSVNDKWSPSTS